MYHFKNCNRIKLVCFFFKFIVHEINSAMFKYGMVVLTGRENAHMTDVDVAVG
jgi:hypothetical protein